MKVKTRTSIKVIILFILVIVATSCGTNESINQDGDSASQTELSIADKIDKDREGNSINLPQTIDKVISMGPSNTEILVALGVGDKIIAIDDFSSNVEGVKNDIPMFSMMTPDGEQIINLQPDVIFVTGMSIVAGDDPFKVVSDAGICIIYIPTSTSISGIKEDIKYISSVMGEKENGEKIISDMENEINAIKEIGDSIAETDKKSVYFEISAAPYMYSFGTGTFLNEMIEIIGANNAFGEQDSWISLADEAVLNANPEVILTSVNYIDDPINEIKSRTGWNEITAIKNDDVYYIDTDASNRPSQNIIKALKEMAKAIYPDKY